MECPDWMALLYMRQIPRLEAQESLRRATEVAVGSGMAKNSSAIQRQWGRLAGGPAKKAGPTVSLEDAAAAARAMGFSVIVDGKKE